MKKKIGANITIVKSNINDFRNLSVKTLSKYVAINKFKKSNRCKLKNFDLDVFFVAKMSFDLKLFTHSKWYRYLLILTAGNIIRFI